MRVKRILLAIDGSTYSRYAAEVAWQIAQKSNAAVTALHVVDTVSAGDLVGHTEPGFAGASDFADERDAIVQALTRMSHHLSDAYAASAQEFGVAANTRVESGSPCEMIAKHAHEYDLVVIGHKPFQETAGQHRYCRQLNRLSAAEYLAENLNKPLLVVQAPPIAWKSLTVMLSNDHINREYIDAAVEFSQQVALQTAIVCVSTSDVEEVPSDLIDDLRKSDATLSNIPIAVTGIGAYQDSDFEYWDNPTGTTAWDEWDNTLLVVPTRQAAGRRLTVADGAPSRFVRYSGLPAVMLYPEQALAERSTQSSAERSAAKRS